MPFKSIMTLPRLSACTAALLLSLSSLGAQSVTTKPVGAISINTLGDSDRILSVPLKRDPAFVGAAASISGNVISVSSANWTANQFAYAQGTQPNRYYIRFKSGSKEGMYYTVASNTTNSLTIDLAGDSLSGLTGTESFEIVPFWTFGTLFPNGAGVTPSSAHGTRLTEILVPNDSTAGTNLAAEFTYYYFSGTNPGWRRVGGGLATVRNDDIILPDSYVIYRQNNSTSNSVIVTGSVPDTKLATFVGTIQANTRQDNFVSIGFPAPLTLTQTRLFESGAFQGSASHGSRADELIVFNQTAVGKNKSAFRTYYYFTGTNPGWRLVGGGLATIRDSEVVAEPGDGFIIRKAAQATPSTSIVSTNTPYSL